MFNAFDLVTPWGTAILALVLGIWGFVKGTTKPAKVISLLTSLVFLLPLPVIYGMRFASHRYDYETVAGMRVRQGEVNRCEADEVVQWEDWTRKFWLRHYPAYCIDTANRQALLVCKDTEITETAVGRFVRGWAWKHTAVITYKPDKPRYTESLFKHEFSHLILFECAGSLDGDTHHNLFKKKGLGH